MSRDKSRMGWTREGEVSWSRDVAKGALPLGTILLKVTVGSTLEATPVVEDSGMTGLSSRRGGHQRGDIRGRDWSSGVGLVLDRLSRHRRKDR